MLCRLPMISDYTMATRLDGASVGKYSMHTLLLSWLEPT